MKPTSALVLMTIVSTLVFLALAILGWGGPAAFFSHPALIALTIAVFAMAGAAAFSPGNLSAGEREDRSNRWVIAVFAAIGVLAAYLPAYTDRREFLTLDGDAVRWLGVILFVVGGTLRIWPVYVLHPCAASGHHLGYARRKKGVLCSGAPVSDKEPLPQHGA